MTTVTNDAITDLCADIDQWDDKFPGGDPALLAIEAHALLGRAREMVKELLAERSGVPPWRDRPATRGRA